MCAASVPNRRERRCRKGLSTLAAAIGQDPAQRPSRRGLGISGPVRARLHVVRMAHDPHRTARPRQGPNQAPPRHDGIGRCCAGHPRSGVEVGADREEVRLAARLRRRGDDREAGQAQGPRREPRRAPSRGRGDPDRRGRRRRHDHLDAAGQCDLRRRPAQHRVRGGRGADQGRSPTRSDCGGRVHPARRAARL